MTARYVHLLAGGLLVVGFLAIVVLTWLARWREQGWTPAVQPGGVTGGLLVVVLYAVLHEGLHVAGWVILGGAKGRAFTVIWTRRGLGIAAVLRSPIRMRAFRAAMLLPGLLLGLLPLAVAFATGSLLILLWGSFFFFEALTDAALLLATRGIDRDARVISHPVELGCLVERDGGPS
ncbi:MAG TPA: metalloprotease family protein [Lacunisphaera sp.]|nr:metalloprotease family protein [Lacunisphaera sp.]